MNGWINEIIGMCIQCQHMNNVTVYENERHVTKVYLLTQYGTFFATVSN